jgi:transposase
MAGFIAPGSGFARERSRTDGPIERRLALLALSEQLDNVAAACRHFGISRTQFYKYRRRFQAEGRNGLGNRPPIPRGHPKRLSPETEAEILKISLCRPDWGCARVARELSQRFTPISSASVHKVLSKLGVASRRRRAAHLEREATIGGSVLSEHQELFVGNLNPRFRERQRGAVSPGQILAVGMVELRTGPKAVLVGVAIDLFSAYVFAHLGPRTDRRGDLVVELLVEAFEFFSRLSLETNTVLLDRWSARSGDERQRVVEFIEARSMRVELRDTKYCEPNGFVDAFRQQVKQEYALQSSRRAFPVDLPSGFSSWLERSNRLSASAGYPCFGETPLGCIERFFGCKQGSQTKSIDLFENALIASGHLNLGGCEADESR